MCIRDSYLGLEEILKRLDRHEEQLVKLREDMNKLREDMVRGFELVERHISAIGARWGIMSEEAFREGLKGLLEKEFKLKVERWTGFDGEGLVYGYPCQVEVDVAIHNRKIVLVEVKSHIRASDVYIFRRKAELYMKLTGKKPDRLLIVTPYTEDKALETAEKLGVEVYTKI